MRSYIPLMRRDYNIVIMILQYFIHISLVVHDVILISNYIAIVFKYYSNILYIRHNYIIQSYDNIYIIL